MMTSQSNKRKVQESNSRKQEQRLCSRAPPPRFCHQNFSRSYLQSLNEHNGKLSTITTPGENGFFFVCWGGGAGGKTQIVARDSISSSSSALMLLYGWLPSRSFLYLRTDSSFDSNDIRSRFPICTSIH